MNKLMKEYNLYPNFIKIFVLPPISIVTITLPDTEYCNPLIPSSDNNNNCFSQQRYPYQRCCYSLPTDCGQYKEIIKIQYDIHIYPLRNTIYGLLVTTSDKKNPFIFFVSDFSNIEGKGKTPENAIENWEKEFHLKFQDIYYKQYWERTDEEQNLYNTFEKFIDIQEHLRLTPISIQQTGKIINIIDNKYEIEWIDESRDIVELTECPDELSHYKIGEYLRAEVLRKYETGELIKIRTLAPTSYRDLTDVEVQEFFDSLPIKNLPFSKYWN
jgi:hypothetical protein